MSPMLSVGVGMLVLCGPGLGSIPAISSNTAKNTFLLDLTRVGAKKYFVRFCLQHNKFSAVSKSPEQGNTLQNLKGKSWLLSLSIVRVTLPGDRSSPPQRGATLAVQLGLLQSSLSGAWTVLRLPNDNTTNSSAIIPYDAAMSIDWDKGMAVHTQEIAENVTNNQKKSPKIFIHRWDDNY